MEPEPPLDASPDVLLEVLGLKHLPRQGWIRAGVAAPESVAAHSWGVAWLVLALLPEHLQRDRALCYAVLHDLPEVRTGDITPHDGVPVADKHEAEAAAARSLFQPLGPRGAALDALWQAYESQDDPEARFVRQLDRLDMALQAVVYGASHDTEEFLASAAKFITDPVLCTIVEALRRRR